MGCSGCKGNVVGGFLFGLWACAGAAPGEWARALIAIRSLADESNQEGEHGLATSPASRQRGNPVDGTA